jgi:hypothetical protein
MKRFVRSAAYMRMRAVTGSLFVLFGITIVVRTVAVIGFDGRAIVPLVMGAALLALGTIRLREYLILRRKMT